MIKKLVFCVCDFFSAPLITLMRDGSALLSNPVGEGYDKKQSIIWVTVKIVITSISVTLLITIIIVIFVAGSVL